MSSKSKKIGFIGLGVMGKPMAKNLIKAGFKLKVFDLKADVVAEVAALGAEKGTSPAQVARDCDIIITMLPNSPQVIQVLTGEDGVLQTVRPGSIIIDMSSISPVVAKKMYNAAAEKEVEMLDAPVSGGEPKAIDGTMSIMVGGKPEVFESVKDILLSMGGSAVLMGEIGSGNITKLANQIMVALHLSAVSEAMVFAKKAGVDPERVYRAIRGGLAGSTVLDAKMPLILDRNFKPGGPIWMHTKDLLNVRDTALEIDAPIPLTTQILEAMKAVKADGHQNDDHCGVIQYWEKLANVTVKENNILTNIL
jgi:2-hydroxy-3-oxopropionate reductase